MLDIVGEFQVKIGYVDGIRLKRALIAGGNRLIQYREHLNKINVFPVADSDTGTNMAGTISSVIQSLRSHSSSSIGATTRLAADAALMGARGNSGAILAQFFHGLAEELGDKARITSRAFGEAVKNSVNYAYQAMTAPQEGTILTVLKSWGTRFAEATSRSSDLLHAMQDALRAARESLKETKEKLPSLKRADVVDAGALGFVHLIEGVHGFVTTGTLRESEALPEAIEEESTQVAQESDTITYTYCTECILEGEAIDAGAVRQALTGFGDSLIVAGGRSKVRVHIHTDTPADVFRTLEEHGIVQEPKAEDMRKQFSQAHTAHGQVAIVIDSSCDLPQSISSRPDISMVPLSLHLGERSYLDKLGITPQEFYDLLEQNPNEVPTTSQPTPHQFRKQLDFLVQHYDHVVVLTISGALSGTYNAANSAAMATNGSIHVIDTKNVSVAIGLIVEEIIPLIDGGAEIDEIVRAAEDAVRRTRLLVMVPTVEMLIRGGRLSKSKGAIARLFGLVPLIELSPEGAAEQLGVALSTKGGLKKLEKTVRKELRANHAARFAFAHVNNERDARTLAARIEQEFGVTSEPFTSEVAPVLACHTGPGTVAVAYTLPQRNSAGS